jgi:hypothetical protein
MILAITKNNFGKKLKWQTAEDSLWRRQLLRNPWGKKEWTGDWSDKSPLWTEKCKLQVDFKNADDGCFWISFSDYDKFFYITTICYYREDFVPSIICDEHEIGGFGIVKFTVAQELREPAILTID